MHLVALLCMTESDWVCQTNLCSFPSQWICMTATPTLAKDLQSRPTSVCFGGFCFWTRQLRIKAIFSVVFFAISPLAQRCLALDLKLSYFHHQSAGGSKQCQRSCSGSDFRNYFTHCMRMSLDCLPCNSFVHVSM